MKSFLNKAWIGGARNALPPIVPARLAAWLDRDGRLAATLIWSIVLHSVLLVIGSPWMIREAAFKLPPVLTVSLSPPGTAQHESLQPESLPAPRLVDNATAASTRPANLVDAHPATELVPDETYFERAAVDAPAELVAGLDSIFFLDNDRGLAGKVLIALAVRRDGTLADLSVTLRYGDPRLPAAVESWLREQRFDPAQKNGVPVNSLLKVELEVGPHPAQYDALGANHRPGYRPPQDDKGNPIPDLTVAGPIIRR